MLCATVESWPSGVLPCLSHVHVVIPDLVDVVVVVEYTMVRLVASFHGCEGGGSSFVRAHQQVFTDLKWAPVTIGGVLHEQTLPLSGSELEAGQEYGP